MEISASYQYRSQNKPAISEQKEIMRSEAEMRRVHASQENIMENAKENQRIVRGACESGGESAEIEASGKALPGFVGQAFCVSVELLLSGAGFCLARGVSVVPMHVSV